MCFFLLWWSLNYPDVCAVLIICLFDFWVLLPEIKLKTSCLPGGCCATWLCPWPYMQFLRESPECIHFWLLVNILNLGGISLYFLFFCSEFLIDVSRKCCASRWAEGVLAYPKHMAVVLTCSFHPCVWMLLNLLLLSRQITSKNL